MKLKSEYQQILHQAKALYYKKAQKIAGSKSGIIRLLQQVSIKVHQLIDSPAVLVIRGHLDVFIRMLSAYAKGSYKGLSNRSLGLLVLGLVYFALPLDLVPDFIPFVGYVDDLSVLLGICKSVQADIDQFILWEREKSDLKL
jgi:uncharacterized membrane protein YkvA (DUF1232 family)